MKNFVNFLKKSIFLTVLVAIIPYHVSATSKNTSIQTPTMPKGRVMYTIDGINGEKISFLKWDHKVTPEKLNIFEGTFRGEHVLIRQLANGNTSIELGPRAKRLLFLGVKNAIESHEFSVTEAIGFQINLIKALDTIAKVNGSR